MKFMKKYTVGLALLAVLSGFAINAQAMETLFYTLRGDSADSASNSLTTLQVIQQHAHAITLVAPQAYQVDADGVVWGSVDPELLTLANKEGFKVMPMVTDSDFEQAKVHRFLDNAAAQRRAIGTLLNACQSNHFYGLQIDFENISIVDKDALTHFYQNLASAMHRNGYAISIAMVPNTTDSPDASNFLRARFENWTGAYDYAALGAASDFITLMAYDQHGDGTTPGPTAGVPWDKSIINYALKYIPAKKILLGIPTYSIHWATRGANGRVETLADQLSYDDVHAIIEKFNAPLFWDNYDKCYYSFYNHDSLNEFIFIENVKSFKEKLALVKKYKLRGIAVWRLGMEDQRIWNTLPSTH